MALDLAALHAAIGLALRPSMAAQARRTALPSGVSIVLELVAGDQSTIERCAHKTNLSPSRLRKASEFFVEQVLLDEACDSYRTLGANSSAEPAMLRRNMALLMRWLHPDVNGFEGKSASILDRTILAERVSAAWENLKNDERRAAYDAAQNKKMDSSRISSGKLKGSSSARTRGRNAHAHLSTGQIMSNRRAASRSSTKITNLKSKTIGQGHHRALKVVPKPQGWRLAEYLAGLWRKS